MLIILNFLIGLIGAALISYGTWLYSPIAGLIVSGLFCLLWSYLGARSASPTVKSQTREAE